MKTVMSAMVLAAVLGGAALAQEGPMGGPNGIVFKTLDANADGKVTPAEFTAAREVALKAADSNADGKLSEAELVAREMAQAKTRAETRARVMIAEFDADRDGALSAAEMPEAKDPAKLFTRADTDKDGALSEAELQAVHDTMRDRMGDERGHGDRKHRRFDGE